MWIFTTYGFFSFTQSTYQPGFIQIRARDDRDLADLKAIHGLRGQIIETTNSDYRWRVLVRPATAARILAAEVGAIDYSNFKNATTERQHARPLMEVWSAMNRVQTARLGSKAGKPFKTRADAAAEAAYQREMNLFSDGTVDEQEEEEREALASFVAGPPLAFEPEYDPVSDPEENPLALGPKKELARNHK